MRTGFLFSGSCVGAVTLACFCTSPALALAPASYVPVAPPTLPSGVWEPGADGRIIGLSGSNIVRQDSVGSATYTQIGSIAPGLIPSWGASFLSISPDGSTIAIGDNGFSETDSYVHLVSVSQLSTSSHTPTTSVLTLNYSAAWAGNTQLYVAGGSFSGDKFVTRIDISAALTATTVINAVPDGSGGVSLRNGQLFTGVGFGPSQGDIRAFDLATLSAASSPTAFSTGTFVCSCNSAGTIDFDAFGNMIIAGAGGVSITDLAGNEVTLAPLGSSAFYAAEYNAFTQQIIVQATDFVAGTSGVFAYAVPAPASAGLSLLTLGVLAAGRKRAVR